MGFYIFTYARCRILYDKKGFYYYEHQFVPFPISEKMVIDDIKIDRKKVYYEISDYRNK